MLLVQIFLWIPFCYDYVDPMYMIWIWLPRVWKYERLEFRSVFLWLWFIGFLFGAELYPLEMGWH